MSYVAAGAAVVGVAGAAMSASASKKAASEQARAAEAASQAQLTATRETNQLQKDMWMQQMTSQSPYMQAGGSALSAMTGGLGLGRIRSQSNAQSAAQKRYQDAQDNYQKIMNSRLEGERNGYGYGGSSGGLPDGYKELARLYGDAEAKKAYQQNFLGDKFDPYTVNGAGWTPEESAQGFISKDRYNAGARAWSGDGSGGGDMLLEQAQKELNDAQAGLSGFGQNFGASQSDLDNSYDSYYGKFLEQVDPESGVRYNMNPDSGVRYNMNPDSGIDYTMNRENFDINKDPSYEWRLNQGRTALERSAAAKGGLLTGQGGVDLINYGQNAAAQEFQNAFNRFQTQQGNNAGEFQNRFNRDTTNRSNTATEYGNMFSRNTSNLSNNAAEYNNMFNRANINQGNLWNRLAAISGIGQTAVNQAGNATGQTAQNIAATNMAGATYSNNALQGAGQARASGIIGSSNALSSGVGSALNNFAGASYLRNGWGQSKTPTPTNEYNHNGLGSSNAEDYIDSGGLGGVSY